MLFKWTSISSCRRAGENTQGTNRISQKRLKAGFESDDDIELKQEEYRMKIEMRPNEDRD